ncbi:MFS transporter, partial [bacterium]
MASTLKPLVSVSALFALDGALLGGWMSHLPDAQRNLNLTAGELGLTLLASSFGALSVMSFTGTLIHRFGSRRVSIAMAVLVLGIVPLLILAPTRLALAAALFCMGASNGTLDVAMNAHSMAVQGRMDRPILSSVHGWFCIGGFLAAGGTALANAVGLPPSLHLSLASLLLCGVLVALIPGLLPDDADQGEEGAKFVVPRGRLLGLGLLAVLSFLAEGTLWDWAAVYFRSELKTTAAVAALGFGVGAGSMAVGRMFGDFAIHRLGSRQALRWSGFLTSGGLFLAVVLSSLRKYTAAQSQRVP